MEQLSAKDQTRGCLVKVLRTIDDIVYTQVINEKVESHLLKAKQLVQEAIEDLDLAREEIDSPEEARLEKS